MITIQFEIPDEVAEFIKTELRTEPKTYIQNQFIDPIVEKYQASLKVKRVEEAHTKVDTEMIKVKNDMKVELKEVKK